MVINFFIVFSLSLLSIFLSLCSAHPNSTFEVGVILDVDFSTRLAGHFHLVSGQLEQSSFQIFNVDGNRLREIGKCTPPSMQSSSERNSNLTSFPGAKSDRVSDYYIDLFDSIMAALPYDYVPFETPDLSSARSYDDQVFIGNYDVGTGDIKITAKRSENVRFTLPIEYDNPNYEWSFLKPLKTELWLVCISAFILTGVPLLIFEHTHNDAFRGPPTQHAGLNFYVPVMSLVFACREKIVTNLARVALVVWVLVALILTSTYTASLGARFTASMYQKADTDVNTHIRNEAGFNFKLLLKVERENQTCATSINPRTEDIKYNSPNHKWFFLKALNSKLCLTIIALFVLISAALCKNINFYERISNSCSTVWSKIRVIFRRKDNSQNALPNPNGDSTLVHVPAAEGLAGQNGGITPNSDHTASAAAAHQ